MSKVSYTNVANSVPFDNDTNGFVATDTQAAIEEVKDQADTALITPRYTILLQYNGTIGDGTWIGYDSLISGNDTPVVIPIKSELVEFTFSNQRADADYTLKFKKNSTAAADFLTVSKVNTQFFSYELLTPQSFNFGDTIFIQYQDDGTNASDAAILLSLKAVP